MSGFGAGSSPQEQEPAGASASAIASVENAPLLPLSSSPSPSPSTSSPPPRASFALEEPPPSEEEDLVTARRCLYLSHGLSAWGARGWEFAAGLALFFDPSGSGSGSGSGGGGGGGGREGGQQQQQQHASLSLVAAMGLAQSLAQALFGPMLGKEVDRLPRLTVAKRAYGLQASATLASALFVLAARGQALSPSTSSSPSASSSSTSSSPKVAPYLLGSVAALFAAAAAVGASWATLSVEREWTQALAKEGPTRRRRRRRKSKRKTIGGDDDGGDDEGEEQQRRRQQAPPSSSSSPSSSPTSSSSALLASINATMRRIDLACLLASPGVAGLLLSTLGTARAVAAIALYSVCAWVPQSWLLGRAVRAAPSRLAEGEEKEEMEEERDELEVVVEEERRRSNGETTTATATTTTTTTSSSSSSSSSCSSSLSCYLSATEALPSALSLALLYLTVLSFGPLATAYLSSRGMAEVELAAWRGAGAAAGLAATAAFPAMMARRSPSSSDSSSYSSSSGAFASSTDAAGAIGIVSQLSCLAVGCVAAFAFAQNSLAGARVLAASLSLSRFGLWLFDLAASQNLQERVPRESLGAVNGVQSTLQAGLGAAAFAFGLLVPRPGDFAVLAFGSLSAVSLAAVVFFVGTAMAKRKRRG